MKAIRTIPKNINITPDDRKLLDVEFKHFLTHDIVPPLSKEQLQLSLHHAPTALVKALVIHNVIQQLNRVRLTIRETSKMLNELGYYGGLGKKVRVGFQMYPNYYYNKRLPELVLNGCGLDFFREDYVGSVRLQDINSPMPICSSFIVIENALRRMSLLLKFHRHLRQITQKSLLKQWEADQAPKTK